MSLIPEVFVIFFRDKSIAILLQDVKTPTSSHLLVEMKSATKPRIAGIGEILWDVFPEGGRLGGAPTNFACHCRQLGNEAFPVSCVGDDDLGRQTRLELERLGVSDEFLQTSDTHPTGRVLVSLDASGKPSYEILENVAWDHLRFTPEMRELAESLDAACFGILSQRADESRETIHAFLRHMPAGSLKILDVNLRADFFTAERIEGSLHLASVLKLSDEELPVLAGFFELKGNMTDQMETLRERFDLDLVACTRGSEGSLLVSAEETVSAAAVEVEAIDSVGAGDSFTAALCTGLLRKQPPSHINRFANAVAAFVCSRPGACPRLPRSLEIGP